MLTKDNYFKINNGYLTNSKIGDFLQCPNYFYRKHITGEIEREETAALTVGKAVDELLTADELSSKYFIAGDRRTKEGKAQALEMAEKGFKIISKKEYDSLMALAIAVEETDAFKQLKDFTRQEIITLENEIGPHFKGVAGIPDFYKIEDRECIIVDLKTTRNIKSRAYTGLCWEYGYFRQMAMYTLLLGNKYPDVQSFKYYHLIVDKTEHINHVRVRRLSELDVAREIGTIGEVVETIKGLKEFKKYNPKFEDAELIGSIIL